jgi:hypothetical protein
MPERRVGAIRRLVGSLRDAHPDPGGVRAGGTGRRERPPGAAVTAELSPSAAFPAVDERGSDGRLIRVSLAPLPEVPA